MNRNLKSIMMVLLIQFAIISSVWASGSEYGASAAALAIKNQTPFTVNDMLRWAVEDEYLARGEYVAIMKKFGVMKPYDNIKAAEEQHLGWLTAEYKTRGLAFPEDGSSPYIVLPSSLKEAAQAGVDAEISNIAMYKSFLSRPEMAKAENASVKELFNRLMSASENHLKAFRTQLSKY